MKRAPVTSTPASLQALLRSLIDYAGLFPPASLDMASTLRHYREYLGHPDAWMLERLIVPVPRLDELEEQGRGILPEGEDDEPWPISALTVPAGDTRLAADVERIMAFNAKHADPAEGAAVIEMVELRADGPDAIDPALDVIPEELFAFFEIPLAEDPRGLIAALPSDLAGAKVRTGGVRPELYPTPAQVARFIAACARAAVPFKATAGLHHPVRRHSPALGVKELGFLNVFAAGVLAFCADLTEAEILAVLEEESPAAFAFSEDGLEWKDRRVLTGDIDDARLTFALSFGSCSFDEPREGLRTLGLLA